MDNGKEQNSLLKFITVLLGAITVISATAYLVCKIFNDRDYNEKWKDYIDCGV